HNESQRHDRSRGLAPGQIRSSHGGNMIFSDLSSRDFRDSYRENARLPQVGRERGPIRASEEDHELVRSGNRGFGTGGAVFMHGPTKAGRREGE
ncbi:hypothetical protein PENTCL1PPCAC_9907, partial [Pristionchus entomophagus]